MSHDLEDFENELKKTFSSEMEFLPSKEMQKIINHCEFSLSEFCKISKGITITAGPKFGWFKVSNNFISNVYTAGYDSNITGNRKMRYVYCNDTRHDPPTPYVISFTQNHEFKLLRYLIKVDKLKAFL